MQSLLLAAAGLAEAAWAMAMLMMWGALIGIGGVAIIGLALRSRTVAVTSLVLFGLFTAYFEPWFCFASFPREAYEDPDVVAALEAFHKVGYGWIITGLFVAACLVASLLRRPRVQLELREIGTEPINARNLGGPRA